MGIINSRLTVFYEEPFWVAVFEREEKGCLQACRVVLGAEPKDAQLYEMVLSNFSRLRFSGKVQAKADDERRINPKRMQRLAHRQTACSGIGTKSQQALKLQQEQNKTERKIISREQREAQKQRQFQLKQEKRMQKHRGH